MKCPVCGSEDVNPCSKVPGRYLCLQCGHTFDLQGERLGYWTEEVRR